MGLVSSLLVSLALSQAADAPAQPHFGIHASVAQVGAYGLAASYEQGALVARAEGHLAVGPEGYNGTLASLAAGYRFLHLGERESGLSLGASGLLGLSLLSPRAPGARIGPAATVRLKLAYAINPQLSLELGGGASLWLLMVSFPEPVFVSLSDYAAVLSASVGLVF